MSSTIDVSVTPTPSPNVEWRELLHISLTDHYSLLVEVGGLLFFIIALFIGALLLYKRFRPSNDLTSSEVELNISLGGIGNVKIKPDHRVAQVAHSAWAELVTRKAGLLFEPDHDLIIEVYDSWHQLFTEIRQLIKTIPAEQLKKKGTQELVNLLVKSLNQGLRPHLTKWQAKFRRWYKQEIENTSHLGKTPQEIQRLYPHYQALADDLLAINKEIVDYTAELKKLIV